MARPRPACRNSKRVRFLRNFAHWIVEDDVNPECQTIARSIILLKLGSARDTVQDVEDVCSDVMARLLTPPGQDSRIVNLPAYVARTAFNACHDYFRRRVPGWRR